MTLQENSTVNDCYTSVMAEVRKVIQELEAKGWTLAAIGREIGSPRITVFHWKHGDRIPHNAFAVEMALKRLLKRRRVPKKKIYLKH